MAMQVTIDSVDRTEDVENGSLTIVESLFGRRTCEFAMGLADASDVPEIDDAVEVEDTDLSEVVFGGTVQTPDLAGFHGTPGSATGPYVSCVDYNGLPDRRVVTETIASGSLKAALQVLETYLTTFGVSLDAGQATGPTLPELVYPSVKGSAVVEDLVRRSGYVFEIDATLTMRMYAPGAVSAPWNITDGDQHVDGDLAVTPSRQDYANTVYVKCGTNATVEKTDTFTGDGVTDTFDLTYPRAGDRGVVKVNGAYQTIGASGAAWTWIGTTQIQRVSGAPAMSAAIVYVYDAQFPLVVSAVNASQVSAVGLYEDLVPREDLFDREQGEQFAEAEVDRRSFVPRLVRYRTVTGGLHAGMTQSIKATGRGISSSTTFLITEVRITNQGNTLVYEVTAVEGTVIPADADAGFSGLAVGGGGGGSIPTLSGNPVTQSAPISADARSLTVWGGNFGNGLKILDNDQSNAMLVNLAANLAQDHNWYLVVDDDEITVLNMGAWFDFTYASGNFTSTSGTWTVASGDQVTFRAVQIGKTVIVTFDIQTTDVSGATSELRIEVTSLLLAGATINGNAYSIGFCANNGTERTMLISAEDGNTYIALKPFIDSIGFSGWSAASGTTWVRGQISFNYTYAT